MKFLTLFIFLITLFNCDCEVLNLPAHLKIGVATSSYQIEGGWDANGKGESIWDRYTHIKPSLIIDNSTGDVACDSYNKWRTDIEMVKHLGVDFYRFSLSWPRILPSGFSNTINPDGVRYYNDIINELIKNRIEPLVTLYHWDLPQPLQDIGGFPNPILADYFQDYAKVAFELFGDRVKRWITFNEPPSICVESFEDANTTAAKAPGFQSHGIGCYLCGKTLLMAHAKTYHLYDKMFRPQQEGKIGISVNSPWYEPQTDSIDDKIAAERAIQMNYGWWVHPILSTTGGYPPLMQERIDALSKAQNFSRSRLPPLSEKEKRIIKGTADFLGLNHYSSTYVTSGITPPKNPPSFKEDVGVNIRYGGSATGFRKLLNWIKEMYKNPLIYVTENGVADKGSALNDTNRITFLRNYMVQLLKAIEDGVNVERYTIWSLMDNMEWSLGYTIKMGLYHVDFSDPGRTRTAKSSVEFVRNITKNRRIVYENENVENENNRDNLFTFPIHLVQ
ncbi:myrosinase 1-like [Agrilus planipennis]|uniref:beta-glucosidase n=1 Tax=Agrilus planipennis TaxID=224129 RepID=A0A1W4XQQ3_AGRPL|nr:myrosinase 1-like [Agrilus planipennis]